MAQELDSLIKAGGPVKKNIAKFTDWLLDKTYINPIRKVAKDVYVGTDDYGKINMFFVEKDFLTKVNKLLPKGEQFNKYRLNSLESIKQEASEVVRRVMPNYDLVPIYIQKLRTIPITGRFFSFMSESVRITGNIYLRAFREIARGKELQKLGAKEAGNLWLQKGATRLGGLMAIGGLSGVALTKGTQAAYGLGQDAVNYAKTFAPEYMQNDKTVVALDPNGDPMLFNWSTWDAFDFPKKPFQVIINEYLHKDNYSEDELATRIFSTVTQELFTPFFGESITQEQISSYFIRNGRDIDGRLMRNPYNTSERYDNTGTYIENITGNLDILAGSMVQALEPGTITSFRRYGRTLDDNYNYKEQTDFGQTIHPELSLFRAVTGVNFMPLNKEYLENMYSFEAIKFKQRKSDRWGELWNVVGKGYTKDDFLDRYLNVNQKYYNDFKRMQKFTESAEFFNLAPLSLLRDSGIGRTDRVALGVGKNRFFRPLGMTNNLRLSLLESESQKDDYFDIMTGIYQMNRVLSNLPILVDSEADVQNIPETFEELERQRNFKGGEISEDYPVTDVAKNPADRDLDNLPLSFNEVASNEPINPFTGEPYTALYYNGGAVRKQYNEGGSGRKKVSDMERLGFKSGSLIAESLASLRNLVIGGATLSDLNLEIIERPAEYYEDGKARKDTINKGRFVRAMEIAAKEAGHPNPKLAAAQSSWETTYGANPGGNLYGIQTQMSKKGSGVDVKTTEERAGKKQQETQEFVNLQEAPLTKHAALSMETLTREYPKFIEQLTSDPENVEEALKYLQATDKGGYRSLNTGYATDSNYISGVFDMYNSMDQYLTNPPPPL